MASVRFRDADDVAIRETLKKHDRVHPVLKSNGTSEIEKFVCSCGVALPHATKETAADFWIDHVIAEIRGPGL